MSMWSATILLFLVMDPLGNLPVFATVLREVPPARQRLVLIRELLIALAVLLGFLLAGPLLLEVLHVTQPALSISGGVILFIIALLMVFPIKKGVFAATSAAEPLIVPLAIPLIAGPSAMTTLLILSSTYPQQITQWVMALFIAWIAVAAILLLSGLLQRVLGHKGLPALERLMGMILIVIAVQMFLDGITAFIAHGMPK